MPRKPRSPSPHTSKVKARWASRTPFLKTRMLATLLSELATPPRSAKRMRPSGVNTKARGDHRPETTVSSTKPGGKPTSGLAARAEAGGAICRKRLRSTRHRPQRANGWLIHGTDTREFDSTGAWLDQPKKLSLRIGPIIVRVSTEAREWGRPQT